MTEPKRITPDELKSYVISQYEQSSLGFSDIKQERKENLEYYENRSNLDVPAGNRSKVQTSDIADHVDWLHSEVMDLLYSPIRPCEFIPQNASDIEQAKIETEYISNVINEQNEGFLVNYQWTKDALIQKNGIIKVYWDKSVKEELETYENMTHGNYLKLINDKDIIIKEMTLFVNGVEQATNQIPPINQQLPVQQQQAELDNRLMNITHNVKAVRQSTVSQIRIENVAPENFWVKRDHHSLDLQLALACGQVERKTRGALIQEGFDYNIVMNLPKYSDMWSSEESVTRYAKEGGALATIDNSMGNPLAEEIEVVEAYVYCDYEGNAKLQLVQVILGGGKNGDILSEELVDKNPYISLTPYINCYRFNGSCPADRIKQIQRVKTALVRQINDNLYANNNPRKKIILSQLDDGGVDDIKQDDIGQNIRVLSQEAIGYDVTPFVADKSLPILDLYDKMATRRTGVRDGGNGLDPTMLKDQSMFIGAKMMAQEQKKAAFLVRTFGETGFRWLYQRIHELVCKYEEDKKVFMMNGKYVEIDPRNWRKRDAVRVLVGTGNNTIDMKTAALQQVLTYQKEAMAAGADGVLTNSEKIYHAVTDMVELMGLEDAERYFLNPVNAQPPEQQPSETFQLGMADIKERAEANAGKLTLDKYKTDLQHQEATAKITAEKSKQIQDAAIENKKIEVQKEKYASQSA